MMQLSVETSFAKMKQIDDVNKPHHCGLFNDLGPIKSFRDEDKDGFEWLAESFCSAMDDPGQSDYKYPHEFPLH